MDRQIPAIQSGAYRVRHSTETSRIKQNRSWASDMTEDTLFLESRGTPRGY